MGPAKSGALAAALLLALPALAQADSQLRAGAAPGELECGADLVLTAWAGRPACVREQTAERLGLELPARAADAPVHSDSAAHEEHLHAIRAHVLAPVQEAREPARIPVPPPERREPVESIAMFKDEPYRITIMMDPDRDGYLMPMTKAETDELVGRFADILGETVEYTAAHKIYGEGNYKVADDFDFAGDYYRFHYVTDEARFTLENDVVENDPSSPVGAGPLQYVRYFSPLASGDHMELITRFMDEMGFDGWTVYDPYGEGPRKSQYNYEYYLFRGTHSDELDTSSLDRLRKLGPPTALVEHLPEVEAGWVRVGYVRENYKLYENRILQVAESWPFPKKIEPDGFGSMFFRFDGISVVIGFGGWSSDPMPDPVISRKDAVERAVEFARTDETLSGPQCGLDIPDRSAEDEPRYVHLTQIGGMPFWKVIMGACDARYTAHELMNKQTVRHYFGEFLGDYESDVREGRKTVRLDQNGRFNLTSLGLYSLDRHDQNALNYMQDIDVAIYVDAISGENLWFSEVGRYDYSGKIHYQTHSEDENVWFLEDGQAVFARDWPNGYLEETHLLVEMER